MACGRPALLVLLLAARAAPQSLWDDTAFKCCRPYEQLDAAGRCVDAPWPRSDFVVQDGETGIINSSDAAWLRHWFPPGPVRSSLTGRFVYVLNSARSNLTGEYNPGANIYKVVFGEWALTRTVKKAVFYVEGEDYDWDDTLVLFGVYLVRPKPGGGTRRALYCVDALQGSDDTFGVVMKTYQQRNDIFVKCCPLGEVVVQAESAVLHCAQDPRAWTAASNFSWVMASDPETPYINAFAYVKNIHAVSHTRVPFEVAHRPAGWARSAPADHQTVQEFFASTWLFPCVDLARDARGRVGEVLGYHRVSRRTRAAFLASRHLPFVSVFLLAAAIAALCAKERTRSTVHGWALACHAACLLGFNAGHAVYYFAAVNAKLTVIKPNMVGVPEESCAALAIPMYFFLTAANTWMTAVSINMVLGMRKNKTTKKPGEQRRRFLRISLFAWSVPVLFTTAAAAIFVLATPKEVKHDVHDVLEQAPWFRPTFAETRTCYTEVQGLEMDEILKQRSKKLGAALFYYLPTLALAAVNTLCLALTVRRVLYLRRGNFLLKKDEEEGGGRRRGGRAGREGGGSKRGTPSEPKSVVVYIKLLFAGGTMEFLAEGVSWALTGYRPPAPKPVEHIEMEAWQVMAEFFSFYIDDHTYAHRTTGYWADLFRALVVLWLAVPEPPDVRAFWRRIRKQKGDSPPPNTTGMQLRLRSRAKTADD